MAKWDNPDVSAWIHKTDKKPIRRQMFFLGQSGWVWTVHHIIEMPEKWDDPDLYRVQSFLPASDGTVLFPALTLFRTREAALAYIEEYRKDLAKFAERDYATEVVEVVKL